MTLRYIFILALILPVILVSCKDQGKKSPGTAKEKPAAAAPDAGQTPDFAVTIHQAALEGNLSEVTMQLDKGVKANSLDQENRTALMYASFNGHTEIIKLLITRGANVNVADKSGTTPLMMASSGPYADAVKVLLDNSADPNLVDRTEHFTALMYAASEGQMEVVKLLLSRQADPTLKDVDGDDAESFARNNGHPEVAELVKSSKLKYGK